MMDESMNLGPIFSFSAQPTQREFAPPDRCSLPQETRWIISLRMAFYTYMYYRYSPASCHDGTSVCRRSAERKPPLKPSSEAVDFDPSAEGAEVGQQKFRTFHSQLTSKRSALSGNGPRGYDRKPYLRFHLSFMRCAWHICLS